ncbi:MAG: alpha/beta hydrolase [Bacilli bacterium]|nr:alpha/beta hydrolase [Bacilli bacterium]
MKKIIDNIEINYIEYGEGKPIVLLHGWGQNIQMMKFLGDKLNGKKIIIDFPGFGESMEPLSPFSVGDYSNLLYDFLLELGVDNPTLIGHSFGGRVSIKYASIHKCDRVILFGSPCIRYQKDPSRKEKLYKLFKNTIFGPMIMGIVASPDYKNASKIMRETLVKVVNEDLLEDAKKIDAPTLLIWGNNDKAVPIELARKQAENMKNAAVIELNGTHYAYIENLNLVASIVNEFVYPKARILKK